MGDVRNANPDQLEQLADKLHTAGDGGVYGQLVADFEEARRLDVSAELTRLQPLLTWLMDAAGQLRDGAAILRGDESDSIWGVAPSDLMAGYHRNTDEDGEWEWEVFGQENIDAFLTLARQDQHSAEEMEELRSLIGALSDDRTSPLPWSTRWGWRSSWPCLAGQRATTARTRRA